MDSASDRVDSTQLTYTRGSLVDGASTGVFANTMIAAGALVCMMAGTVHEAGAEGLHSEYVMGLSRGQVLDEKDKGGQLVDAEGVLGRIRAGGKLYRIMAHGALINEPTDDLSKLAADASLKFIQDAAARSRPARAGGKSVKSTRWHPRSARR